MQPWAIDCPGGVDAVIFANGQSDGDQDVLKQMYQMRSGVYEGLIFAEKSVDTIANAGADPRVVASDLRSQAGAVNKDPGLSDAKHRGETLALGVVATLLEGQHDLPVPSDKTPRHQETIEQVMKEKKISYQQAQAIVISKKLRESDHCPRRKSATRIRRRHRHSADTKARLPVRRDASQKSQSHSSLEAKLIAP